MNNVDHMKHLIQLVESAEQLTEAPMSPIAKGLATAAATASMAGGMAAGSDIKDPDTKPKINSKAYGDWLDLKKQASKEFTADWIVEHLLANAISVKTLGKKGQLRMDIANGKLIGDQRFPNGGKLIYKFTYTHQIFPSIHLFGKRFGIDIAKGKQYTGVITISYGDMTQNYPIQTIKLILDYDNIQQHKANLLNPEKRDSVPFFEYPKQPGADVFIGKPITDVLGLDPKPNIA